MKIFSRTCLLILALALVAWPHTSALKWTAPSGTPAPVSYNVYHSTVSGGPYTKVNTAPVLTTSYSDATDLSGFWVVTSVDSNGDESIFSNEAAIPNPPSALGVVGTNP